MANEFGHKDVGDELSKANWLATDTHKTDNQEKGDILYFDGTSWLSLPHGDALQYLATLGHGENPAWTTLPSKATIAFPGTVVFNTTGPANWTDLDLSAIIGANAALVVLMINSDVVSQGYAVRPNGSSVALTNASAASIVGMPGQYSTGIVVTTADSAGIIEHKGCSSGTVSVTLLAYIKM